MSAAGGGGGAEYQLRDNKSGVVNTNPGERGGPAAAMVLCFF